jgi:hypothetical protein
VVEEEEVGHEGITKILVAKTAKTIENRLTNKRYNIVLSLLRFNKIAKSRSLNPKEYFRWDLLKVKPPAISGNGCSLMVI